jgi:hypothetical protein
VQDEMDNDHQQVTATWRMFQFIAKVVCQLLSITISVAPGTKPDGVDFDGSDRYPPKPNRSWSSIIAA